MADSALTPLADGVRVRIRVTPRAHADALGGTGDDAAGVHLKARVVALPTDGKANDRLVRLVAHSAGVAPSAVRVASGSTSRVKSLVITGPSEAILERLQKFMEHPSR
jgi:uncharacterized protein YggU (UPF0235/DUF167 family)